MNRHVNIKPLWYRKVLGTYDGDDKTDKQKANLSEPIVRQEDINRLSVN